MALPESSSILLTVGIVALIVWRIYSRVRRMVGRQKFSGVRPWITIVLFPTLLVFLLFGAIAHPINIFALIAGAAVGIVLGRYGLKLTVFEDTSIGKFYTPNAHLGIALSLLLLGRIAFRFLQLYGLSTSTGAVPAPDDFVRSPFTLLIFGTLACYYITYAIGLLRWRRSLNSGTLITTVEQSNA